jgi:Cyclic nucleotide-binding domain
MAINTTFGKVLPSKVKSKKKGAFDAQVFLESVGASRRVAEFRKKQTIFSQGEAANSVIYVQKGSVNFTVVNESGKEAVVAIFGPRDFFWRRRHGGSGNSYGDGNSDFDNDRAHD